MVKPNRSRMTI